MDYRLVAAFLVLLCVLLVVPTVQAIRITDNLQFTIPPNSTQCIEIFLPDDAGIGAAEKTEFLLMSNATWGDLTEQIVRTDEENVGLIPICFRSYGLAEGNCTSHKINISTPTNQVYKEFFGTVCVSGFPDIDTPSSPSEGVSNTIDLFSVGFSSQTSYAKPGEEVNFTVYTESLATLSIRLQVSGIEFTESSSTVITPGLTETIFTGIAPEVGRHEISVIGNAGCSQTYCKEKATATLVVSETSQAGFSVSIFPYNINTKSLDPVQYKVTVTNHGESQDFFSIKADLAQGLESSFSETGILVDGGGQNSVDFTVTPTQASSLYEIIVYAEGYGLTKQASAYLTTNEMLTDILRSQNELADGTAVQGDVDSWYATYRNSNYGENLDQYEEARNKIEQARQVQEQPVTPTEPEPQPPTPITPTPQPQDNTMLYMTILVVVLAIVAIVFFVIKRKPEQTIDYKT